MTNDNLHKLTAGTPACEKTLKGIDKVWNHIEGAFFLSMVGAQGDNRALDIALATFSTVEAGREATLVLQDVEALSKTKLFEFVGSVGAGAGWWDEIGSGR